MVPLPSIIAIATPATAKKPSVYRSFNLFVLVLLKISNKHSREKTNNAASTGAVNKKRVDSFGTLTAMNKLNPRVKL